MPQSDGFQKVALTPDDINQKHTFGVPGAWFVGQSRDYISVFESDNYTGFAITNSCGRFIIAKSK